MKKKKTLDAIGFAVARYQVDLVTRFRFSHIWHNNLFAYAERHSNFDNLEEAQAEAEYRNQADGIDSSRPPETLWQVRS
jgi:hypothetical protein